ncbi:Rieske (2Fe-2S) protein [Gulosibacter bifidus]|uniref:Cytochrome bc1 complex Rieske iron-sulfur subunit n=1 Tax=Gulosibacter bifidus TaxID=272239 RepID=A0ABW5RH24_9MICO|nr:Rieske (2Fe-2S) protein [Gulosibacter bifidus]
MTDSAAAASSQPTPRIPNVPLTRRALVRNTALVGGGTAAAMLLSGCSEQGGGSQKAAEPFEIAASEVPVGAGIVLAQYRAVVTQPQEGTFKAFNAECTHKGCLVSEIREKGAFCGCHSSYFDINTGEAVSGPAQLPLPELTVTKNGDMLSVTP